MIISLFRGKGTAEGVDVTTGLWKGCVSTLGVQACTSVKCNDNMPSSTCSKLLAGRAFMTLACIISAVSALCFLLSIFLSDGMRSAVLVIGKGLAFVCLAMGIIGVAIGIVAITDGQLGNGIALGAGSIIGIVALIVNLFGVVLSIVVK